MIIKVYIGMHGVRERGVFRQRPRQTNRLGNDILRAFCLFQTSTKFFVALLNFVGIVIWAIEYEIKARAAVLLQCSLLLAVEIFSFGGGHGFYTAENAIQVKHHDINRSRSTF